MMMMMMSLTSLTSALLACSLLVSPTQASSGVCSLCVNNATPKWLYSTINQQGSTCLDMMLNMATLSGSACTSKQNSFRYACCTSSTAPRVQASPTPAPVYNGPKGDFPVCPICRNGKAPTKISVIAVEYIGTYSCTQLDAMGRHGAILFDMCTPLQLFAADPCGCGSYAKSPTAPSAATVTVKASAPAPTPSSIKARSTNGGGRQLRSQEQ